MKRITSTILILTVALSISACSLYRNDRMWIPDEKYAEARKVFEATNSLELTAQKLRESQDWRRAEINTAIYRLKQQYRLEQPAK